MNEAQKIGECRNIIQEVLSITPHEQIPAFVVEPDTVGYMAAACQQMRGDFIARGVLPLLLIERQKKAATNGAAALFATCTLLAETIAKLTRNNPTDLLKSHAQSASEMLENMTQKEFAEYCLKYDLDIYASNCEHTQNNQE